MMCKEPTLRDYLTEAEATPIHDLYERAFAFLHDSRNPQRLYFAHSLGVASVGHEIEGTHYRLTDSYGHGSYHTMMVQDLVAVEVVPDEAVIEDARERRADPYVGERLWRLRSARIGYAGMGFDDVFPAVIEDLAQTELLSMRVNRGYDRPKEVEYSLPLRNFRNQLEDERLEQAQHVVGVLLDKLICEAEVGA